MKSWKYLVGAAVLAVTSPLAATAVAAPTTGPDRFEKSTEVAPIDAKLQPRTLDQAPVKVIVELDSAPVTVIEATEGRKLGKDEKAAVRDRIKAEQAAVRNAANRAGGTVLAEMQDAYNGVKVQLAGTELDALAGTPGVKAVHAVEIHEPTNATSVPYLGVPQVWQSTGFTGKGVKVGIIDSGIDYVHAAFAGPGTVEAFQKARATDTQPADPALFGPNAPRVKGGWDLVGNDYNAASTSRPDQKIPKPDPNPLDCHSHGSHVAGTAAGSGVTEDGRAYTGPFDASTATKKWKIGPGVAPQADLYAYRVFGCAGSTDVTVEAIDRAVKDGMDVINMSLGSVYGTADDPSAVASSNAVAAGVVVVTSAGNSGPNPYLTGSPGTGRGVISVAANDPTASFPGAQVRLPDGSSVPAVNANGVDPIPAGPFTVVALRDDPATTENEALGCSVDAYTRNGVTAGGNQLAVTVRGSCARAARAVYGQQAGAAAVAMIDTSANFPPYEGPILANPDTGEAFTVTIPFLGIRGLLGAEPTEDGDKLVAAHGGQVGVTAQPLPNPAFSKFASFSSGGPRSGDSGLKPNVTAPGVSTSSAAVGTGNDSSIKSGTSMAAPHVAGVAALNVQAHPDWDARAISANLVNTADPAKVGDYRLTLGGGGLVDTAQSVASKVTAVGDRYATNAGFFHEPSLSFGFAESTTRFSETRTVTLTNRGTSPVTYAVSNEPTQQSRPATVRLSRSTVTVPAGGTATVNVTLTVPMNTVGSALGSRFAFHEASGSVVFKAADELRVPWLLVPRAQANVEPKLQGILNTNAIDLRRTSQVDVEMTNRGGALAADADVYTLGLTDDRGDQTVQGTRGIDVRALGVQSFDLGADKLMVFAVNSWDRYSNAAGNSTEVSLDTNRDGKPDRIVYATDSGSVRSGNANGLNEVFVRNLETNVTTPAGYYPVSPTDNSTVLLPVRASSLGVTRAQGGFSYTGKVSSLSNSAARDSFSGSALYNPWQPALTNGQQVTVERGNAKVVVPVRIDREAFLAQRPAGVMVVVFDNAAGESEATLLRAT